MYQKQTHTNRNNSYNIYCKPGSPSNARWNTFLCIGVIADVSGAVSSSSFSASSAFCDQSVHVAGFLIKLPSDTVGFLSNTFFLFFCFFCFSVLFFIPTNKSAFFTGFLGAISSAPVQHRTTNAPKDMCLGSISTNQSSIHQRITGH